MQLLFQVQIAAAAAETNRLVEELLQSQAAATRLGPVLLVASQVIAIVGYWLASKAVAKDESRFSNALKTWLFYVLWFIGLSIVAGAFMALAVWQRLPALTIVGVVLAVFLMLLALFRVPMQIYKINFGPAFLFVLLSLVIYFAAQLAITLAADARGIGKRFELVRRIIAMPAAERSAFIQTFRRRVEETSGSKIGDHAAIAGDQGVSLRERHAALQRIYADLQQRHRTLQPSDLNGRRLYRADKQRYEFLVKQLQEDATAAAAR